MHQLAFVRVSALAVAAVLTGAPAEAQQATPVTVVYAASLVTPMEGPIARELTAEGIGFSGEPGGSKKLANLISAGARNPDVFISVDPAIVAGLGSKVASSTAFARTSLGIAWSSKSQYDTYLNNVIGGRTPLWTALSLPGLRIGRTDPRIDPKGVYTIAAVKALAGAHARVILGSDDNPEQIFPEEDLLARIDTGEIDVGFFYQTEAIARGLRFYPLPVTTASRVTYVLAIMQNPPHPDGARRFAEFILHGRGRNLLERAGLEYLSPAGNP